MFKILLTLLTTVLINTASFAQLPDCGTDNQIIYGLGNAPGGNGRTVFSMTKSGGTITYNGVFTTNNVLSAYSLAIADLGDGPKFYTHNNAGEIIRYSGTSWQPIYTATHTYNNSAGNGSYLHFHSSRVNQSTENRISRFDGTTLTTLWDDQSVYSPVADIAVDDNGNVYFFTGATPYDVNTLNIMSPTGVMIEQIPLSFDGLTGYGACFLDNQLCVFFGSSNSMYPNQMLPITISGNTATLGTAVPVPQPVIGTSTNGQILLAMIDIASCSSAEISAATSDIDIAEDLNILYSQDALNIISKSNGNAEIFNSMGQKMDYLTVSNENETQVDISGYSPGVYYLILYLDGRTVSKKIVKQ